MLALCAYWSVIEFLDVEKFDVICIAVSDALSACSASSSVATSAITHAEHYLSVSGSTQPLIGPAKGCGAIRTRRSVTLEFLTSTSQCVS